MERVRVDLTLALEGYCEGCQVDPNTTQGIIFWPALDDGMTSGKNTTATLGDIQGTNKAANHHLRSAHEGCPCETTNPEQRAPREVELSDAINQVIKEKLSTSSTGAAGVEFVEQVKDVTKEDLAFVDVACDSTVQEWSTLLITDLQLVEESMMQQDKELLEQSLKNIYNQISFMSCDGKFKQVKAVELVSDKFTDQFSQRHLQGQLSLPQIQVPTSLEMFQDFMNLNGTFNATSAPSNWTIPPSAAPSYAPPLPQSATFKLEGQCRNCLIDGGKFQLVRNSNIK